MPVRISKIEIQCKCGEILFSYYKRGTGRLIKCFVEKIHSAQFILDKNFSLCDIVECPSCSSRIGTVYRIKGKLAIKLNQGKIKNIQIG